MEYEGTEKIEIANTVERVISDKTITDAIAEMLSSLGSIVNMDSIYDMLYLAYMYNKKNKIDVAIYAELYELKKSRVLADVINNMDIKRSFYFVYGSYVMESEGNMTIITYRYYLISITPQKKGLTVKVSELQDYIGPNMGRIRK